MKHLPRLAFVVLCGLTTPSLACTFYPKAQPPTEITNVCQLQNISNNLSGSFILGNDIDASEAIHWHSGTGGFLPIGNSATPFSGVLDGKGHVISNLSIRTQSKYAGLFGYLASSALIQNLGLKTASVTNNGGATGWAGGLAGYSLGQIDHSYSFVEIDGGEVVGGLVGQSGGAIRDSTANLSNRTSWSTVGGLVGVNTGTISGSYADISAPQCCVTVGGLVGNNKLHGIIVQSNSTGTITDPVSATYEGASGGGLVGNNSGTITQSFADVSLNMENAEGFVAFNDGNITDSYATGSVSTYSGFSYGFGGGFVASNTGPISSSYAIGPVSSGSAFAYLGGFAAYGDAAKVVNSYWDVQTSGQTYSSGGIPSANSRLKSGTLPAGLSADIWSAPVGNYPVLGEVMNDERFLIPTVYSTAGTPFEQRLVTFQSPWNIVLIEGAPYTLLPIGQLQSWQYLDYPAAKERAFPDETCLAAVYAMVARLVGRVHPEYTISCTDQPTSFMCGSKPSDFAEPLATAHIEWFFNSDGNAIPPTVNFSNVGTIGSRQNIDDPTILNLLDGEHFALIRGWVGNKYHWMIATAVIKDAATGAPKCLVATDPWLGQQVMIDMASDTGYHYAVLDPPGASGNPESYKDLSNFRFLLDSFRRVAFK